MPGAEHQGGAGSGDATPQTGSSRLPPVAAFDFDGTLTVKDSFIAFLRWRMSAGRSAIALLRLIPAALSYAATRDRGRLKGAAVTVCLKGLTRDDLGEEARRFAASDATRLLRPDALAAWVDHGARGHRRVIVTASPEEIVAPFARRLGADALIGSRLAWTAENRVGDGLAGPNCRGMEKVRRLHERFGQDVEVCDAYGDTAGDREMLAIANRGHMRRFNGRPVNRASATPARPT